MKYSIDEFESESEKRPSRPLAEHCTYLVICSAIIIGCYGLEVRGTDQVGSAFGPNFVLPPLCLFRWLFGINCPGCGLTRSLIYFAHGEWRASWEMHSLGWIVAVVVVWQIPYRIYRLCRPGRLRLSPAVMRCLSSGGAALVVGSWLLGVLVR